MELAAFAMQSQQDIDYTSANSMGTTLTQALPSVDNTLERRKICFLIRQLNQGGAQRQLVELVKNLDHRRFEISVVTFYAGGQFEQAAKSIDGVNFYCANKRSRWDLLPFMIRLYRLLRRLDPHILHGYLSTANLLLVILRPFMPKAFVVWGVRSSNVDVAEYDWMTRAQFLVERLLARFANLIILNSASAMEYHVARGFPRPRCAVVSNGIDVTHFRRDDMAGRRFREQHQIKAHERVILLAARLDPMKDHVTFLKGAAILRKDHRNVRFVLVGHGPIGYETELRKLASSLNLDSCLAWAGAQTEMVAVYSGADVLTLPSRFGEGFPNVVAEAMACGVPCVVTNVGDAGLIVGSTGYVVEFQHPEMLAAAWRRLLALSPVELDAARRAARERIASEFNTQIMAERSTALFNRLI